MKCCVSTDVGTWTNLLTFEPDPDYSPDARTGLNSPIYALQRRILLRLENPTYRYWAPVAAAMCCFTRSVKEGRDLETEGRGRSRSLEMAPFDRQYTTFYWSAIVYIALSGTVF